MVKRNTPDSPVGLQDEISAIREDMNNLREDLGELVNAMVEMGRDRAGKVRAGIEDRLEELQDTMHNVRERGERAAESVQHKVEDHPFASVAVAFGLGVVAGKLFGR